MIAALLLAAAPVSATDADLAFAKDARRIGQWSAFRKWADRDAVMFTPQAVWARTFLKGRHNSPKSISWRPAQSFVSCDGRTAVNTGPWFTQDNRLAGYFTTVWQHTPAGWRWVYDGGIPTPVGKPNRPKVRRASCNTDAPGPPLDPTSTLSRKKALTTLQDKGRGESADETLGWDWKVSTNGTRTFRVYLWSDGHYAKIIDAVTPPDKR